MAQERLRVIRRMSRTRGGYGMFLDWLCKVHMYLEIVLDPSGHGQIFLVQGPAFSTMHAPPRGFALQDI